MPAVALNGSRTQPVTTNDIRYRVWNPCLYTVGDPPTCVGGWEYFSGGSSTIYGTVSASISNVFVNGTPIVRVNDSVTETENPQVPGEPVANHTGGIGRVIFGNNNRVFAGGLSVAVVGSIVQTHSTPTTTIADGATNVFIMESP